MYELCKHNFYHNMTDNLKIELLVLINNYLVTEVSEMRLTMFNWDLASSIITINQGFRWIFYSLCVSHIIPFKNV